MLTESLPSAAVGILTLWLLLYAPGQALLARRASSLPLPFVRVLASAVTTTLLATGLAAVERFSLGGLLAGSLVCSLVFVVFRGRLAGVSEGESPQPRDLVGPALFLAALVSYWPAYPVFLSASDSTAYVASGVSLARHGTLAREDELGPSVPLPIRTVLFDSMSQVFLGAGPPYRRMPGAMMIESLDSTRAWPCFFPVPSVWAAIAAVRDGVVRAERAPEFAPLFAALALWAFWQLARLWMRPAWAVFATVLLGACGPFYVAARQPMSEPIAAFFALAGLALVAAAEKRGNRADALLAGAALGAATFTRVEVGALLALAFAMRPAFLPAGSGARGPLPRVFFVSLLVVASLTVVQVMLLPGTYVSPLFDHGWNAYVNYQLRFGVPSYALITGALLAVAAVFAVLVGVFGFSRTVRWGLVLGAVAGHTAASRYLVERTPMWLSFYVGWSGLALAALGMFLAWRHRTSLAGGALVVALAAIVALILFYNPHVYPALPWGARRFVPLLLPLLVLFATYAAASAAARSRILGLALAGAMTWAVVAGGRPAWGEPMFDGAWEQLQEVARAIPENGVILVDRELSSSMLGPSLWLVLDRNNLTVPPVDSRTGGLYVPQLVHHFFFERGLPVYYVTRGAGDHRQPPYVKMIPLSEATIRLRFLRTTYDQRPERMLAGVMPLAIYRLQATYDSKTAIVK